MAKAKKKKKKPQYGNLRARFIPRPKDLPMFVLRATTPKKRVWFYPYNKKELSKAIDAATRKLGRNKLKIEIFQAQYQTPWTLGQKEL